MQAPERINELGRRKRDKLAPLLAASNEPLPFDADAFDAVVRQISGMLWGGNADMVDFVPALGETCPAWAALRLPTAPNCRRAYSANCTGRTACRGAASNRAPGKTARPWGRQRAASFSRPAETNLQFLESERGVAECAATGCKAILWATYSRQ
ncbi:MAG: hypothetical protein ACLVJ8_00230 [Ruthenibacterium lactatiformans]